MSSKISLMSFLAIASLLLISCGESEQYKQGEQAETSTATPTPKTTESAPEVKAVLATSGGNTPEEAVKTYMDSLYECNFNKAFSYVEDGTNILERKRIEYKKAIETVGGVYDAAKSLASSASDNSSEKSKNISDTIGSAMDSVKNSMPATFDEACDSVKSNWNDYTFSINKTDETGDEKAILQVTLQEEGKIKDDTLDAVKIEGKWFVVYKEIDMKTGSRDSFDSTDTPTTSSMTVDGDIKSSSSVSGDLTNISSQ